MKHILRNRIVWVALALALPTSALADLSQTTTLAGGTSLNLDTGATGSVGAGDIVWSGTSITPQGNAKVADIGPFGSLTGLTKALLDGFKGLSSSTPIPTATLVVGEVFAVFTNGGNTAGVLVTAKSGGSITLQFITFGVSGGGGGGGPTITSVTNNSSDIPPGFPNSGIAQGSLFVVKGSGLSAPAAAVLQDSANTLPFTLNGANVTVAVGGVTKQAALYYAIPTQVAGVLPSSTPTGAGTLTVTYNGGTATFNIQVVAAAPGITVYNGSGVAQHALLGTLVTYTDSAKPGEILILWGTGFGAVDSSDTTYNPAPHQTTVPYTIYVGGVLATSVPFVGASVYPGVGVIAVAIPQNAPTGCYVPIAAVANSNVVSNTVTIPIAANGGVCSDPQLGYNGTQISTLNGTGTVKTGFLIVSQSTIPGTGVLNSALASFQQSTSVASAGGGNVSIGSCILSQTTTGGSTGTVTGLNAGTITVTGPGGSPVTLTGLPQVPGIYLGTLASIPANGGAYVFNGTAGSQVGAFTATVNFPNPLLVWTNQSAAATVSRSQGLNVAWTGGAPGTYVLISGSSTSGTVTGSFTCIAPQSALSFAVPTYVLLGLPAGSGTTTVSNSTNFTTFTATGIDFGGALGSLSFQVNSNYN